MASVVSPADVTRRFNSVRRSWMLGKLITATAIGITAVAVSILFLASIDFLLELPRLVRWVGMVIAMVATLTTVIFLIYFTLRNGEPRRAAARMEHYFLPLGQRLRTTLDVAKGKDANSPLAKALAEQTNERCDAVNLESFTSKRVAACWCLGALALMAISIMSSLTDDPWSLAIKRVLGADQPYTHLTVEPGNFHVNAGETVRTALIATGRTNLGVSLRIRNADEPQAEWLDVPIEKADSTDRSTVSRVGWIPQLKRSIEYQFRTSKRDMQIYRIDVRIPIEVESMQLTVHRPDYTELEDRVFETSDITVLEDSTVQLEFHTTRALERASLVATSVTNGQITQHGLVSVGQDKTHWQMQVAADQSTHWTLEGMADDGTPLASVAGWIRVKPDRPPRLRWLLPIEPTSVHVLAEVPLKVRIDDDYGLSEAGIQFEISGGDSLTLVKFQAVDQSVGSENSILQMLEGTLPLESIELSEKDYIAYYAYAIDNRPGESQRVESEWRYIDIRSLKTTIRIEDPQDEPEEDEQQTRNSRDLDTLDELIDLQRYLINRTRVLSRMKTDELTTRLGLIDRHTTRQSELASRARLLADRLAQRNFDDLDAFRQAEASMIQAADALNLLEFDAGLVHQKDAQRSLVEARTKLQLSISLNFRRGGGGGSTRTFNRYRFRRGFAGIPRRPGRDAQRPMGERLRAAAAEQMMIASLNKSEQENLAKLRDKEPGVPDGVAEEVIEEGSMDRLTAAERQVKLVDEMAKLSSDLNRQNWATPLMSSRSESIVNSIDEIAGMLSTPTPSSDQIQRSAAKTASQLRELALHVDTINSREPISRILGTRDILATFASLEKSLADLATLLVAKDEVSQNQLIGDAAESLVQRAATLRDVVTLAADARDAESQRFSDAIAEWLSSEPLLDLIDASQSAGQKIVESNSSLPTLQAGNQQRLARVGELLRLAQSLDRIAQQMVSPELEKLRQIESEGAKLAQQAARNENASPKNADVNELSFNEVRLFAEQLQSVGMNTFAEQINQSLSQVGQSQEKNEASPNIGGGDLAKAISVANLEVQKRIRELILVEVSAVRDTPIPPQFLPAVNDYFRAVVGDKAEL